MIGMKLHQSILMIVVSYDADTQDTLQYLLKFNKICHELFYSQVAKQTNISIDSSEPLGPRGSLNAMNIRETNRHENKNYDNSFSLVKDLTIIFQNINQLLLAI